MNASAVCTVKIRFLLMVIRVLALVFLYVVFPLIKNIIKLHAINKNALKFKNLYVLSLNRIFLPYENVTYQQHLFSQ